MSWDSKPEDLRDRVKSLPGKKNTKEWCRGKVGRHHEVEVRRVPHLGHDTDCHRWPYGDEFSKIWLCYHEIHCVNCGKILKHTLGDDCPDWTAKPAETQ
jgi:hypothetical protein